MSNHVQDTAGGFSARVLHPKRVAKHEVQHACRHRAPAQRVRGSELEDRGARCHDDDEEQLLARDHDRRQVEGFDLREDDQHDG